ncbi:hypothetical protein WHR41_03567 [Cladosporium halotolerans]|uniref:Serine-rich protein n=1 Tax=Cladosporium halotolerans TaxID=1052096 RepID=A0AB34KRL0_9PEZI
MFLDPAPIGHSKSNNGPSSPFFASQSPLMSPREQSWRIKRSPLQDQSPTFKKDHTRRSTSTGDDAKPTVRLVGHSPVSRSQPGSGGEQVASEKQDSPTREAALPHKPLLAGDMKPASASDAAYPPAPRVSDERMDAAPARKLDLPPAITLLPSNNNAAFAHDSARDRRSTSSRYSGSGLSNYSAIDSPFAFGSASSRTGRLSDRSTLVDEDIIDTDNDKEGSRIFSQPMTPALETVPETPSDRSTAPSVSYPRAHQDSNSSLESSSVSPAGSALQSASRSAQPWTGQYRYPSQDSLGSLPASSLSLPRSPPRPLAGQDSQETLAYERQEYPETSSPNFIAFNSSSSRSPDSPLHNASSFDSIQGRLNNAHAYRLDDLSPGSSPRSHYRSSSADSLPPLHVPRRREQEQPEERPQSMAAPDNMDYEEIDLEPWPRQPFTSHLSTIASESDRAMSPAQFSHFSMGSGVLTIDDACSIPMSAAMSRHSGHMSQFSQSGHLSQFSLARRASEPMQSPSPKSSPQVTQSSGEDAGDMTLGIYRAESAKPEPLFRGRNVTPGGDVRYNGPLPPLPPMPHSREGDENGDSLSALSAPSLKKKRSGYSIRGRSNSTPSGSISRHNSVVSYVDSERWSRNSSVFPAWAKNFYGGYAALLSASKISLSNPPTPRPRDAQGHVRSQSQWTERSITSRLGTGYSEIENGSPTSSHFLPSIFRPRTRTLGTMDSEARSFKFGSKTPKRKPSKSSGSISRTDSMAITADPYPPADNAGDPSAETLPSGHPKYGKLKDNSSPQPPMPPLPRKYSKQKLWDEMSFPRPMTKDRLSDFKLNHSDTDRADAESTGPHLRPNAHRAPHAYTWRSPSFVESLDTLFSSRGNRQILLFATGFLCPLLWLLGALLPLPPRHARDAEEAEKALPGAAESEDDLKAALGRHQVGDARARWDEERAWLKARWWRTLNRVMCFVGVGVVAAVIALAVIATRR